MSAQHRLPTAEPVAEDARSFPAGVEVNVNHSAPVSIPVWTYIAWRRQIHWPLLATAIVLTVIAVTLAIGGLTRELMPWPVGGAALGALAAMWHWYLRLPIAGVTAHRLAPATDIETDHNPATHHRIECPGDRAGLLAASPRPDPTACQLAAPQPLPALTIASSKSALEATPR